MSKPIIEGVKMLCFILTAVFALIAAYQIYKIWLSYNKVSDKNETHKSQESTLLDTEEHNSN